MDVFQQNDQYVMDTYARQPICIESGKGAVCVDIDGKEYLDFGSGIGVNALGYCDDDWCAAVVKQATTIQHTSNLYYNSVSANLAQILCEKTGYSKAFFANSGAEANECAIKIARKYSNDKYGADSRRTTIITLVNSFHGRTITTLSATGQDSFHQHFAPFTMGFKYAIANDIEMLEELLDGTICAIMVEPIQGEGGVVALNREYLHAVANICNRNDILLIADEVQTGIGRTGKILASRHFEIHPNLVTLAKGVGGGLPIGVVLADSRTQAVLSKGQHGTTYGANPVACAGATVMIDKVCDEAFLRSVTEKGNYLINQLHCIKEVEEVTGICMMVGIKLKTKSAQEVQADCLKKGLIVLTAKDKIRLLPPLIVSYDQINRAIDILKDVLK